MRASRWAIAAAMLLAGLGWLAGRPASRPGIDTSLLSQSTVSSRHPPALLPSATARSPEVAEVSSMPAPASAALSSAPSGAPTAQTLTTSPVENAPLPEAPQYWLRGRVLGAGGSALERFEMRVYASYSPMAQPEFAQPFTDGVFELSWRRPGPVDVVASTPGYIDGVQRAIRLADERGQAPELEWRLVPAGALQGRVINEEGLPVASARVEFGQYVYTATVGELPPEKANDPEFLRLVQDTIQAGNPNPAQVTDPDGRFALKQLPQGGYPLHVTHPDYAAHNEPVTVRPGYVIPVEVVLERRNGRLRVDVLDAAGRPLEGSRVALQGPQEAGGMTDAQGRWGAEGLTPGDYYVLATPPANATPSAGRATRVVIDAQSQAAVVLQLGGGAVLRGLVERAGQPVPGVAIQIQQRLSDAEAAALGEAPEVPAGFSLAHATVTTDNAGRFEVADLLPGDYHLTAEAAGGATELMFRIAANETTRTVTLQLGTAALAGSVKAAATGQPVNTATIRIFAQAEHDPAGEAFPLLLRQDYRTDARGQFRIEGLQEGTYTLEVEAAGFARHQQVVAVAGAATLLDTVLEPESQLIVTVLDRQGMPRRGVNLQLAPLARPEETTTARTDKQGMVSFSGLPAGAYALDVTADELPGVAPYQTTTTLRSGETVRLPVMVDLPPF